MLAMQSRPSWLTGGGEWNEVRTTHDSMTTSQLGTVPAHLGEFQLPQQTQPPAVRLQAFGAYSQQVTISLHIILVLDVKIAKLAKIRTCNLSSN